MLDVYIHDYCLLKRKLHASAKAFMSEGKVATDSVAIDAPGGFLFEWWSVFWDIFISRTNREHSDDAAAYVESQQTKARGQQQLQQLMQHCNVQLQQRALCGSVNGLSFEGVMGKPSASVSTKMYEERMKSPRSMDSETSPSIVDANKMALLKTATNQLSQLVQNNYGNMAAALQQIQARTTPLTTDIKSEVNLGGPQKGFTNGSFIDIWTSNFTVKIWTRRSRTQSRFHWSSTKALATWPLTGLGQLRPSLGMQVQKPTVSDKVESVFDVETGMQTHSFQGHSEIVNYICWDANEDYLASVSQNLVKIWSMTSGECIQELNANANEFHSCVFGPSYSNLLVIGGTSFLELWNIVEHKRMTIAAQATIISALAQSPVTGMVPSTSHDCTVKLWK